MTPEAAREWGISNARVFVNGLGGVWPISIKLHPRDALLMVDGDASAARVYEDAFRAEVARLQSLG